MSSCKKWNSCNDKCKRSGGGRGGGGGGNGVIGKDGATGPRGPTGPTGPAPTGLNGMIPYEPYNQNNAAPEIDGYIRLPSADTTTYIQFTAPSTGYYTKARMLTNFLTDTQSGVSGETIKVRMGIYDNSGSYTRADFASPTIGAFGNQGIPNRILGQGVIDISGSLNWNWRYLDISLNQPVNLKINDKYWFAYSTYVQGVSANIFTIGNNYFDSTGGLIKNGNSLSVLDISDNNTKGGSSGAGGGDAPAVVAGPAVETDAYPVLPNAFSVAESVRVENRVGFGIRRRFKNPV